MVKTELYFGRNIGVNGEIVTDKQWDDFIESSITLYFPDGLTVIDAIGQWRMSCKNIVQELSKIVIILHSGTKGDDRVIEHIRNAYKNKFRQESIMRVDYEVNIQF